MADFNKAIAVTLRWEGGYTDNPADSGGATNMGIEQRDLPNIPIRTLTVAQAEKYYLENYWKPLYGEIVSQDVATKLFDLGVLFGVVEAVKALQRALNATPPPMLTVDGTFGPETLLLTNEAAPVKLLSDFKSEFVTRAHEIVAEHPEDAEFLDGWLRRINS